MKNAITNIDKFEFCAKKVAESFMTDMKEFNFDTFADMTRCYYWTAKDIKEEVDYTLREIKEYEAYVDELDGTDVIVNGDSIPYRKFSNMWRKYIKSFASEGYEDEVEL